VAAATGDQGDYPGLLKASHAHHFGAGVGVADHRRRVIRKHAGHRRQVADVAVDHAKQRDDGGLVGGDAVEIAHDAIKACPKSIGQWPSTQEKAFFTRSIVYQGVDT